MNSIEKEKVLQKRIVNKTTELKDWHKQIIEQTTSINKDYKNNLKDWDVFNGCLKDKTRNYQAYVNFCVERICVLKKEIDQIQKEIETTRANIKYPI